MTRPLSHSLAHASLIFFMGAGTFSVLFTTVPPVPDNFHVFNQYTSACYVSGTILGNKDTGKQDRDLALMKPYFLMGSGPTNTTW